MLEKARRSGSSVYRGEEGREETYWDLKLRKARDSIRGRVLVGVIVSNVLTPLRPGLGLTLGPGSSIVVTDGFPPLGPRLGFRLRLALFPGTGKVGERIRRSVLVGVVVPNVGTPLGPSLGFGRWIALLPRTREIGKRVRGPVLVGVVVTNVGTPLRPGLGFALEARESRDGIRSGILVGVVVTEVGTPLSPSYRRRESLDGIRWGVGRSGKLTFWLRSRRTSDGNGHGVDRKSTNGEGSESDFGEHDDRECRKKEQMTTAPGLELER